MRKYYYKAAIKCISDYYGVAMFDLLGYGLRKQKDIPSGRLRD